MNIGVLGGTFDPVHNGHLIVAEEARNRLNLTEVIFVPAGQPWLKADRAITPAKHRLQMLRLALADKPYFKLSAMEIERAGPSYTIDTITELRGQLDAGDELFFILGQDSLAQLPQWRNASQLIQMCYFVAVPRPGSPRPNLKALEASIPGISQRVMLMDEPHVDISAEAIRDRVARGLSIRHLVPEPVNRYIKEHKLYLA
ncbi:MAG: nicotinate-nucleotide adenylyltransferase [Dehalococcoidales bacterium]